MYKGLYSKRIESSDIIRSGLVLDFDYHKSYVPTPIINGTGYQNETKLIFDRSKLRNNGLLINGCDKHRGGSPPGSQPQSSLNGFNFDEVNDHISVTDNPSLRFGTNNFTVSVTFIPSKVNYGGAGQGTLVSKNFTGLELFIYQSTFACYVGGTANLVQTSASATVQRYYQVFVTRTGSTLRLFTDFTRSVIKQESVSTNSTNASNIGTNVFIGRRSSGGSTNYFGVISSTQLYNRALTFDEIQYNYSINYNKYYIYR
jgi:hypothetical protein